MRLGAVAGLAETGDNGASLAYNGFCLRGYYAHFMKKNKNPLFLHGLGLQCKKGGWHKCKLL